MNGVAGGFGCLGTGVAPWIRDEGRRLELSEKSRHPRLLARRVVAVDSVMSGGFVDGGGELLGCVSSGLGLTGGNRVLKSAEMRLDGRFVAQVLLALAQGYEDPLSLLLGVSQSSSRLPFKVGAV